jgi:hypothetical protein
VTHLYPVTPDAEGLHKRCRTLGSYTASPAQLRRRKCPSPGFSRHGSMLERCSLKRVVQAIRRQSSSEGFPSCRRHGGAARERLVRRTARTSRPGWGAKLALLVSTVRSEHKGQWAIVASRVRLTAWSRQNRRADQHSHGSEPRRRGLMHPRETELPA